MTDGASNASNASNKYYTIAITGSSGLLGTALIDELSKKENGNGTINGKPIRIVKLARSGSIPNGQGLDLDLDLDLDETDDNTETTTTTTTLTTTLAWNPNGSDPSSTIDPSALANIDTIVHLAGENVGSGLLPGPLGALGIQAWSEEKKNLILSSRVGPTKALAEAIAAAADNDKKSNNGGKTDFIVASGVGVYGSDFFENEDEGESENESDSPDESFDTSNTGGFLAEVSRQWEAASQPATATATSGGSGLLPPGSKNNNRVRVVNLRIAPVLSKFGGALGKLYPIFFLGGGGIVGNGRQYFR